MIKTSIKINRSIDAVWAYFTDTDNWIKWYGGGLKEVSPCWQSGATLVWALGGASSIKKLTPKEEIFVSGAWMDTSYMFHASEESTTIVEIIQSDPKGGASFSDGGRANKAQIEKRLENLKKFIENETTSQNSKNGGDFGRNSIWGCSTRFEGRINLCGDEDLKKEVSRLLNEKEISATTINTNTKHAPSVGKSWFHRLFGK